ncbi:aldehyde dehydrogenase [Alicyclobacillus mengziensis]|uniref:Aldehyde dehydrogenase n=1 Tax=Alicyclobacillus mengziensis TaxID=2931921 RepID=A0A9X7W2V9_9BACL|nr:aldehyde dehydrogenase [Alicyclobacillus mengziensis]QSO49375.1 aldehyde dehydrogenase [Alicyclobacillus mengziensis]
MSLPRYDQFINGQFVPSVTGEYFPLINPETGEVVAKIANSVGADVEHAVEVAKTAFHQTNWRTDKAFRVQCLRTLAAKMRAALPDLVAAESRVTGRPIREMQAQLSRLPEWYDYFASVVETLEDTVPPFGPGYLNYTVREPLGVVGLLTPWNHPLLILTKKLAPALAAGNAVVIKPSEQAPITVNILAALIKDSGIPDGIVGVVHGYGAVAGKALSENNQLGKIDLTGGTPTGRSVAAAAGHNLIKVAAELGGKASVLIFQDANLEEAVNGAVFAGYIASGQTCVQGARMIVPESMYDEFVEAFVQKVKQLRIGSPLDVNTDVGPMVSERQLNRVLDYVNIGVKEGAKLVYGGTAIAGNGWYVRPAVFTEVTNEMTIAQEEIFGPVVCIMKYRTEEEAITIANGTEFGLAMSIWTNDIRKAHRVASQLEAGVIWINDHHRINPSSPWGGYKDSGLGRENGIDCYKDYTQVKNIIVNTNPEPFDWFDGTGQAKRYS